MGTRAAYFVGDPRDLEKREWLGCTHWDGYPDGVPEHVMEATSEEEFRRAVADMGESLYPASSDRFPYPWSNNLFLTDYVYAWMNGTVYLNGYSSDGTQRWITREAFQESQVNEEDEPDYSSFDVLRDDVKAPGTKPWSLEHDSSIIVMRG